MPKKPNQKRRKESSANKPKRPAKAVVGLIPLIGLCGAIAVFTGVQSAQSMLSTRNLSSSLPSKTGLSASDRSLSIDTLPLRTTEHSRFANSSWSVWDGISILDSTTTTNGNDNDSSDCDWVMFRGSPKTRQDSAGKQIKMCVHPGNDVISKVIRRRGFWADCTKVANAWRRNTDNLQSSSIADGNRRRIHVEVGANIGACVLELLLAFDNDNDLHILAFEPNPVNLLRLTSTLVQLEQKYRDRVTLFPIALGAKPCQETIFGSTNNLGHSVVGKPIPVQGSSQFNAGMTTYVERLDDVIATNTMQDIGFMKMDAHGFECQILDGMPPFYYQS